MRRIKNLFGNYEMTWKKVIIFAIITAVYTAFINQFEFLNDTSFRDIAVYLDCWILFAVFIISNCKNYKEATLKCFVFFLISQPLIYLIQVPFNPEGFGIFRFYKFWFIATLFTLPGAVIAYQIKRDDWISVLVLGVANGYLAYASADYLRRCLIHFPNHLLSCIFCILLALFFIYVFISNKKQRLVSLIIIIVIFVGTSFINGMLTGPDTEIIELEEGNWTYQVDDESIADIKLEDNILSVTSKNSGTVCITVSDDKGNTRIFYATINGNDVFVSEMFD